MKFSSCTRNTTLTAAQSIPFISGGTNFNAIFHRANRAYDRIVILSDMQGGVGGGAPVQSFADYKTRYSVPPRVFSFDLKGYGTLQFPQERVYRLAGWSDRAFELMQKARLSSGGACARRRVRAALGLTDLPAKSCAEIAHASRVRVPFLPFIVPETGREPAEPEIEVQVLMMGPLSRLKPVPARLLRPSCFLRAGRGAPIPQTAGRRRNSAQTPASRRD